MYSACIATTAQANKLKSLRLTIRALKAQSLPPEKIIIAINGGVNAELRSLVIQQSTNVEVIFADSKKNCVSHARNIAATYCNSEFITFIDDDTILGGIHVAKEVLMHADGFDFSCGASRFWAPPNWESIIAETNQSSYNMELLRHVCIEPVNINRKDGMQKLSNYSFIGNFGIVRADCFKKVGGFDESFLGWGYEDADLMQELLHREMRFFSMKSIGVRCFHLSHFVDKSGINETLEIYERKIKARGRRFRINHHFGVFENDGWDSNLKL